MPTMNTGLGGPAGYGENVFSSTTKHTGDNDDGTVQVDVTSVFGPGGLTYFGVRYTEIYINSNGFISFGSPDDAYNVSGMNSITPPALVPFFSDMDITAGGEIYWDIDTTNGRITITWDDVQPFGGGTANDFQVVITDLGGGEFDVEYIYENITWTTVSSQVAVTGYTDGDSTDVEFDGSGNATEMADYETNDFGGGDPAGTFVFVPPDGVVTGTSGDDTMALGYSDSDGDAITTGADNIDGDAGNDDIDGDDGNDTILGGAGNDTLRSGEDAGGTVTWTDVAANDDVTGTTGTDYYRWLATNGANSTVRLNNSANPNDGDGVADYILIATTNQTGTLTVGDFDMGTDKIVLQENYTGISTAGGGPNYTDVTLTYGNGNQQSFRIYHQGAFSSAQAFTTTPPSGASDNDSLDGGDDADTFVLTNGFGSDTIVGGEGGTDNDTVDASALTTGVTVAFTGNEAGTVTDGTHTATFSEIETLELTDNSDSFDASQSTVGVTLNAHTGQDTILGSSGADSIDGGYGHDLVYGGAGDDTINGNTDLDTIYGGEGNDVLYEGSFGVSGGELYGEAGDDTLYGGTGTAADLLDGGDGDDLLIDQGVGGGNDTLLGGAGNDVLQGADGANLIRGDTTSINPLDHASPSPSGAATNLTINNTTDGDIELWWIDIGGTLDFYQTVTANGTVVQPTFEGDVWLLRDPGGNALQLIETTPNLTVDYGIDGLDDTVDGGLGNDTIYGEFGNDLLDGGDDDDSIDGGFGHDTLLGGSGADTISGGGGSDTLSGGSGSDSLTGGEDADTFILQDGFGADTIAGGETFTSGSDSDTLDASAVTAGVTINFSGDEAGTLSDGADTITFSQIEDLILTGQADTVDMNEHFGNIDAGAGNDVINDISEGTVTGGLGNDDLGVDHANTQASIEGGAGNDTISFDSDNVEGVDVVLSSTSGGTYNWATAGNGSFSEIEYYDLSAEDFIVDGGAGSDTLIGSRGSDYLDGGADGDSLEGGAGVDYLSGGAGDDTLDVGGGNSAASYTMVRDGDTVTGSTGADVFVWEATAGASGQITLDDGAGTANDGDGAGDIIQVLGDETTGTLVIHGFEAGVDRIHLSGRYTDYYDVADISAVQGAGVATVTVTYDNGNTQTFEFHHDAGATLSTFTAFTYRDDVAGLEIDVAQGGDDADSFVVSDGFDGDTVIGGEGGTDFDVLDLRAITTGVTVDWTTSETGTVISGADTLTWSGVEQVILTNNADSLDASAETVGINVDGADGNDTLRGGTGGDTLIGGARNDDLWGGAGDDSLEGGAGFDEYLFADNWGNDTVTDATASSLDFGDVTTGITLTATGADAFSATDGANTVSGTTGTFSNIYLSQSNDYVDLSGMTANSIQYIYGDYSGAADSDTIIGSDLNDQVYVLGDNGTYLAQLGGGNDYIEATDQNDTLYGEDGNDTLRAFGGNDYLDGGDGDDQFYNSEGNNTLIGGAGNDWFFADDGSNQIWGGTGDDTIDAEDGDDTIFVEDAFGSDVVTGGETAESRGDRLDFSAMALAGITVTYSANEAGSATDGTDTLGFTEIEALTLTAQADSVDASVTTLGQELDGLAGSDTLIGGSGADTLTGGDGDDSVQGGDGADLLKSGQGTDTLEGGAGNDTLMNSAGDDSLVGGTGDDLLVASAGNDTLEGGAGFDTLMGGTDSDSLDGGRMMTCCWATWRASGSTRRGRMGSGWPATSPTFPRLN